MGDPSLGKLTASLEELSLKKQLPLRQQVQKPMLKYSNSVIKPVQLFNHAEYASVRNTLENRSTFSNGPSHPGSASSVSAPFRSNNTNPEPHVRPSLEGTVPAATSTKPASTKGHSNPYARPLSAKDIVSDLQSHKVKKTSNTAAMHSVASDMMAGNMAGTPMFGFQMNAFMRPQSALRRESPLQPKTSSKSDHSAAESSGGKETKQKRDAETIASQSGSAVQKGQTTAKQEKSSASTGSDKTFGPANPNSSPLKQQVSSRTASSSSSSSTSASSPAKAAAGSQTAQTTVGKSGFGGTGLQASKPADKDTVITYAKSLSSLPRPGSAARAQTPDSTTKVRNLNYTPTKPYSEVMNPPDNTSPPPKVGALASKPPVSALTKTEQTMATATYESKQSSHSSSSKPGTLFYRKESKSEEMIHEQRPPAVGAPAMASKVVEKDSSPSTGPGECSDDDESEPGVPSGERMPGDGEASYDEYDDEEDLDDLEDDYLLGSDGESDGYSFTSSLSRRSSSSHLRFKSGRHSTASTETGGQSRPVTASPDRVVRPALTHSLFPSIPPTINFVAEGEKVEQLPWDYRKYLKWRMSPITPNVVKSALARVGFRISKRNNDWLGCWGKHMKSPGFKALKEYQKLNHFPGSFQIGRKDRLWRNLSKMQVHFGKKEFGFFPQTYCLPYDAKLLKRAWEDGGTKQKWIIKPPASARGIGIKVINKWTQIPRRKPVIVQKYLSRPYLINSSKFDLRIYVYVSSYDPLRLYVFEDGLARFASTKYSSAMKNLGNKFMHLTNYSVNKKNADYQANTDESVCQGHKWSLKALWNYMKRQGISTNHVWESIKDLIVKTIICADGPINSMVKANCKSRYCVHELFGFDILLDESLKPWILEVNISPSLHSNSQLDINIKGHMIRDLLNIGGFRIPDRQDLAHSNPNQGGVDLSMYVPPNSFCMDKRLFTQQLSPDERAKHAYYSQRHQDEHALQSMLDTLTPDDVRILCESIDEDSRKGSFQRIFPTPSTHKYLRFFETARYYNLLLDQWVGRFNRMEQRGISLLESLCEEGVHLEQNTENPHHQWNPPSATCHSFREPRLLSAPLSKHKDGDHPSLKSSTSASQLQKMAAKKHPKVTSQRSTSQSSSVSSVKAFVLSPQPVNVVTTTASTPRVKAGTGSR